LSVSLPAFSKARADIIHYFYKKDRKTGENPAINPYAKSVIVELFPGGPVQLLKGHARQAPPNL
jgi:hypothetical protein